MAIVGGGRILIGEASDSESDDGTSTNSFQQNVESKWSTALAKTSNISVKVPHVRTADRDATVVLGEASESSEEEIMTDNSSFRANPTLNQSVDIKELPSVVQEKKINFQYNSLLHKKLRERNASLGKRIAQAARQPYGLLVKEINSISNQLVKSQSEIQEVGPILRQININIGLLDEKLDISLDCAKSIPPIKIQLPSSNID